MRHNTNRSRICAALHRMIPASRRPHRKHPRCGATYAHVHITHTCTYKITRVCRLRGRATVGNSVSNHAQMAPASPLGRARAAGGIVQLMQEQGTAQCTGVRTAVPGIAGQLEQYREGWTIDQAKAWCRSDEPAWSVGFIGPSANVASMGVTRAGGRPKFGSEVDPVRHVQRLHELYNDFSGGTCLGARASWN